MFDAMPAHELIALMIALHLISPRAPKLYLEGEVCRLASTVMLSMAGAPPRPLSGAWS